MAEGKKKVMDTLIEGGKKKLKSGLVKAGKALEDAYYYIVDKWNLSGSPLHLPGSENRPRNLTPEQRKKFGQQYLDYVEDLGTQIEIEEIEGFGPNTAQAIKKWFSNKKNIEVIRKLHSYGVWPTSEKNKSTDKEESLEGLCFLITGTLDNYTRDEVKNLIKRHGGKVSDTISKKINYLVIGKNPGSKLEKAKELSIEIIGEDDLTGLIKKKPDV